jgi:hypothetical protein
MSFRDFLKQGEETEFQDDVEDQSPEVETPEEQEPEES